MVRKRISLGEAGYSQLHLEIIYPEREEDEVSSVVNIVGDSGRLVLCGTVEEVKKLGQVIVKELSNAGLH